MYLGVRHHGRVIGGAMSIIMRIELQDPGCRSSTIP